MSKRAMPFKDDAFWKLLASSSFRQWIEQGPGCYILTEPDEDGWTDGDVRNHLKYLPYDKRDVGCLLELPYEAREMLDEYLPDTAMVLVEYTKDGEARCHTLDSDVLKIDPIDALREIQAANGGGRLLIGELVKLEEPIGDLRPGAFLFLGRTDTMLTLCPVEMGRCTLESIGDEVQCHADYEECFFKSLGIMNLKADNAEMILFESIWDDEDF